MAFNFFTSFYTALSNPNAYSSFQKEMNLKAVEQVFFNSMSGKTTFNAVVLQESVGNITPSTNGSRAIRVRPLDIHDFILPEPCNFSGADRQKVIMMHPVAFPDTNFKQPGGDQTAPIGIPTGHIVECFFGEGPQGGGRLRGLSYRPKIIAESSNINLECLQGGDSAGEAKTAFDEGNPESLGEFTGPPLPGNISFERLTPKAYNYVNNSTRETIKTTETTDKRSHQPIKMVYNGKIEKFKGKEFENGLLPPEIMGQSTSANGYYGLFVIDVVESFDLLARAFEKKFNGKKLYLNDSYRTFNRQIATKNNKLKKAKQILAETGDKEKAIKKRGEAAKPGTSRHGMGLAFDFSTEYKGTSGFNSETYKWMIENAPKYGFHNPPTLRDGKGVEEAWHIEYKNVKSIWIEK